MATTRKNSIPALPTITASAVALVATVVAIFGRATETYRAFALLLVQGRVHFTTTVDGKDVPDWGGKSQEYRDWTAKVYADAGITDKALLRKVQSSVRNHVSDVAREVMKEQGVSFALYGMDEASQSAKQKNAAAKSIVRTAKNSPIETAAALSASLLDPKGPADGSMQLATLIHNQLVELSKSPVSLDQQADLARLVARIVSTATALHGKLTGSSTVTRSTRTRKAA